MQLFKRWRVTLGKITLIIVMKHLEISRKTRKYKLDEI